MLSAFFLVVSISTFAQQKQENNLWHLTIADSTTGKGIDRATVTLKSNTVATDVQGGVNFNRQAFSEKDTIRISSVGYKTSFYVFRKNRVAPDTLKLSGSVVALQAVEIKSSVPVTINLGDVKKVYKGRYLPIPNEELARYIPNEKKLTGTITRLEFVVNDGLKGIEMPFKVQLFTKRDHEMYPEKEMISDSLIIYNKTRQTHLSIDVSKYQLELPENGFFIVFETLSPAWYSKKTVRFIDQDMIRVPGLDKDYVGKSLVDFDEKDRKGASYSLFRRDKAHWELWTVLSMGEDFAMGAVITP